MGLFSATMSGSVEKFGHANFNNEGVTVAIGKSGNAVNQNVSQKVIYCGNERGKLLALREFIKDGFRPPAILFTETKERCQVRSSFLTGSIKILIINVLFPISWILDVFLDFNPIFRE